MNTFGQLGTNRWSLRLVLGGAVAMDTLLLAVFSCIAEAPPAKAQPTVGKTPPAAPSDNEIRRAIADLSSPEFVVREKATQRLWKAGAAAQGALEKAVAESDDFETVCRARQIVAAFQLGIFPDTPAEIVATITRFRWGNYFLKQQIAQQLRQAGKTDLLRQLIEKEPNRQLRQHLSQMYLAQGGRPMGRRRTSRERLRGQ